MLQTEKKRLPKKIDTRERPYPHFKYHDEMIIACKKMTEQEASWYNALPDSYGLRVTNYGWFPTEIIMGVIKGRYEDTRKIGATISGNMGSAGLAVTDYKEACRLLSEAGCIIEYLN